MSLSKHSRYFSSDVVDRADGPSLEHRIVGAPESYADAIEHTLVAGETLPLLARRYYGNEALWWRIADANGLRFPLDFEAGDVLTIVPLRVATRTGRG